MTQRSPAVVYQWMPTTSGRAVVGTCGGTTDFNTIVYVRQADCHTGVDVVNNDDACKTGSNPFDSVASVTSFTVTGGQTYFIVVSGVGGAAGHYTLTVRAPVP